MEESMIPSLSTGIVGSRFVSQNDVDIARARRDEQWKAAYARLGQEPPPPPQQEDSYDGRSLAEKLAANKIAKQEEWEEKTKLANQFRALEEDEIMFLDSVRERQEEEERQRKEKDGEEVKNFKVAVAARNSAVNNPPPLVSTVPTKTSGPAKATTAPIKKDLKKSLKGVVVKRKAKPAASTKESDAPTTTLSEEAQSDSDSKPDVKRRKISQS